MLPANLLVSFKASVERLRHRPCLRYFDGERWRALSWLETWDRVRDMALGLRSLGVKTGDRVAILSGTRLEWTLCDLAALSLGAVVVPIYPSSTPEQAAYILRNSGAKLVFVEDSAQLGKVRKGGRRLILMTGAPPRGVLGLEDLARLGGTGDETAWEKGWKGLLPTQTATIVYTSGTTGPPKGAVLTHGNFIQEVAALMHTYDVCERHTALFFLPLAHIFARAVQFWQLTAGFVHAYSRGLDAVPRDLEAIRPHFFASVPRIFEKIHEKIRAAGPSAPRAKRLLLRLFPGLLSRRIRAIFGGRLRFAISGGAPLCREIAEFFGAHGVKILEGYGLTETTAGVFINTESRFRFGTVGRAVRGTRARIARDGEILIKSPLVFQGYYRDPRATRRVFTRDGWFKTGDIGEIDRDGFLKITDRKKDLIVTAAGKNVAPQNIENLLKTAPGVSQVMVHGDRRKYLTALVTLDREAVARCLARQRIRLNGHGKWGEHPEVRRLIRQAIEETNKRLASFETIKRFAILEKDFTPEAGELTPTLKLKRKFVGEKYSDVLDGLY